MGSEPQTESRPDPRVEPLAAALHEQVIGCLRPIAASRDVCVPTKRPGLFHNDTATALLAAIDASPDIALTHRTYDELWDAAAHLHLTGYLAQIVTAAQAKARSSHSDVSADLRPVEGPRATCPDCGSVLLGRGTIAHHDDGSHSFSPTSDVSAPHHLRQVVDAVVETELRSFVQEVEYGAEDMGQNGVLIADLWAVATERIRRRALDRDDIERINAQGLRDLAAAGEWAGEPEHVTDGSPCWCQPAAERQPDGSYVVVHKEMKA